MQTLDNMVTAGEVEKLQPVRVAGVKRPVPVYGLKRQVGTDIAGADLLRVLSNWA